MIDLFTPRNALATPGYVQPAGITSMATAPRLNFSETGSWDGVGVKGTVGRDAAPALRRLEDETRGLLRHSGKIGASFLAAYWRGRGDGLWA